MKKGNGWVKNGYVLGGLFASLYVICGALVYAVPNFSMRAFEFLTHSTVQFSVQPFSLAAFVFGAVLWAVAGFVVAFLHAKLCDCCEKK